MEKPEHTTVTESMFATAELPRSENHKSFAWPGSRMTPKPMWHVDCSFPDEWKTRGRGFLRIDIIRKGKIMMAFFIAYVTQLLFPLDLNTAADSSTECTANQLLSLFHYQKYTFPL